MSATSRIGLPGQHSFVIERPVAVINCNDRGYTAPEVSPFLIVVTQENNQTENLFSYGTLQRDSVQLDTFGRLLSGTPDALIGYRISMIPITDQTVIEATGDTHYRNLEFTGHEIDQVEGTAFPVTVAELEKSDEYEKDANYKRVQVRLRSGISSWVYLHHSPD